MKEDLPATGTPWPVNSGFTPFSPTPVTEDCLDKIFEIARMSPSGWDFHPWRWIVVKNETGKRELESSTYIKVPLSSAPVVLVCLADTLAWKTAPQHLQEMVRDQKLSEEDAREVLGRIRQHYSASPELAKRAALANAFAALHEVLLAAVHCKLCGNWITEFNEERIKTFFNIPDQFIVAALVALGYREEPAPAVRGPSLRSFIYRDKFGQAFAKR
jgi:nitroreductase